MTGAFGVTGTGDTSGFGGLVRSARAWARASVRMADISTMSPMI